MGGFAWVTLATDDSYSLGALVLGTSLKRVGTQHQLVVLVTPGVTSSMRERLSSVFNLVQEVNILDSKDAANLRLLQRPELGITFTKLHCWRLTQFDKCVFLDADTLVLQNCDELFEREELSAAPDVGWPDCFNSGVFVYRPSNETYEKLTEFALEKGSFDGGDQGLLNLYFSDWATKDISRHLPFIYNMCSVACYSYLPAFKQFGGNAKIIHFIGIHKPWLQYVNTETRKVQPPPELKHLEEILQRWWNIFFDTVLPQLTDTMARSTKNINYDPWEEYDQKTENPPIFHPAPVTVPIQETISLELDEIPSSIVPDQLVESDNDNDEPITTENCHILQAPVYSSQESQTEPELLLSAPESESIAPNHIQSDDAATATACNETSFNTSNTETNQNGGLAGVFAELSIGGGNQPNPLEDFYRRQGWEVGKIDYMGKDSFDNIWSKICETIDEPKPEPVKETPAEQKTEAPKDAKTETEGRPTPPKETPAEICPTCPKTETEVSKDTPTEVCPKPQSATPEVACITCPKPETAPIEVPKDAPSEVCQKPQGEACVTCPKPETTPIEVPKETPAEICQKPQGEACITCPKPETTPVQVPKDTPPEVCSICPVTQSELPKTSPVETPKDVPAEVCQKNQEQAPQEAPACPKPVTEVPKTTPVDVSPVCPKTDAPKGAAVEACPASTRPKEAPAEACAKPPKEVEVAATATVTSSKPEPQKVEQQKQAKKGKGGDSKSKKK